MKVVWKRGDRLRHRWNGDLGPGIVLESDVRTVSVQFPRADTTLRLASDSDALVPLEMAPGSLVCMVSSGETVTVSAMVGDGSVRLADGRRVLASDLWPLELHEAPLERLARGQLDPSHEFIHRLDAMRLAEIREAGGLGSFLGGRILLFPHQLYVAGRASERDPVRWLLCDEVGLGKTVEACLVLNRLVRTGRAERTLVVAPETLTVQWLSELWRKYHQVFVLLDEARLKDVARDFGRDFNPFDVHRRAIIGMEALASRPKLVEQAVASGIDLLIVDEAHHLRRPEGHPGNPAYRAIAPIAELGKSVLLLTATPLEDDVHGFFRLLELLHPSIGKGRPFAERLLAREPLPACTSSTRRVDIGGLPPRVPCPVEAGTPEDWAPLRALEEAVGAVPTANPVQRQAKARRLSRALESGAALEALLPPGDAALREQARGAMRTDPRVKWLAAAAARWQEAGEKTLVFVATRETLESLRTMLRREHLHVGAFHEALSPGQRDIEVAQFRLKDGPSLLISTECGGEGRNFQFCRRLVLFDLPWNPMAVEQRIGRLDRIGRTRPVEIVYFRPPSGLGAAVARLYESVALFERPLGGLSRELAHIEDAITEAALEGRAPTPDALVALAAEARSAYARVEEAAYHELHRDPFEPSMSEEILSRVPPALAELTRRVVLHACESLGFHVEKQRGRDAWSFELGNLALVDSLPGVPGGSSFLGTFDRAEAVENEALDFFASGHALVEGVLAEIEDSPRGRVALLDVESEERGLGLLTVHRSGPELRIVARDLEGKERPAWAALVLEGKVRPKGASPDEIPGWEEKVRRLARRVSKSKPPLAVAVLRLGAAVLPFPPAAGKARKAASRKRAAPPR